MTKILIDFSHHDSTAQVEREPTAIEIAQNVIAKLKTHLCDLQSHNLHLEEVRLLITCCCAQLTRFYRC